MAPTPHIQLIQLHCPESSCLTQIPSEYRKISQIYELSSSSYFKKHKFFERQEWMSLSTAQGQDLFHKSVLTSSATIQPFFWLLEQLDGGKHARDLVRSQNLSLLVILLSCLRVHSITLHTGNTERPKLSVLSEFRKECFANFPKVLNQQLSPRIR